MKKKHWHCTKHEANEMYFPTNKELQKPDRNARQKMHFNALLCCSQVVVLHYTDQCAVINVERETIASILCYSLHSAVLYQHN